MILKLKFKQAICMHFATLTNSQTRVLGRLSCRVKVAAQTVWTLGLPSVSVEFDQAHKKFAWVHNVGIARIEKRGRGAVKCFA